MEPLKITIEWTTTERKRKHPSIPLPWQYFIAAMLLEAGIYWLPNLLDLSHTHCFIVRTAFLSVSLYALSVAVFVENGLALIVAVMFCVLISGLVDDPSAQIKFQDVAAFATSTVGVTLLTCLGIFLYVHVISRLIRYVDNEEAFWLQWRGGDNG